MKRIAAWIGALMGVTAAADTPAAKGPEQAVIVHFTYGSTDLTALFELEERLEAVIAAARVGEYDGNEVAVDGSDGYLYMYGSIRSQQIGAFCHHRRGRMRHR
jgi:hypothetical protein